jgi:hypothetical protein
MDKDLKETDWFPLTHCPIHEGVYKTLHLGSDRKRIEGYSYWSRRGWGQTLDSPYRATVFKHPSLQQSKQWKGILKNE